jgi:hypothetical protein
MITYFLICLFRRLLVKNRTCVWLSNGNILETTYHYDGSFESVQYSGSCTVWYVVNPHTGNLSRRCSLSEETRLALAWEQHKRKK